MERGVGTVLAIKGLGYLGSSCLKQCTCDELPCPLITWLTAELQTVCPELQESVKKGGILLVGDLRNILSNIFSPLTALTSEVLDPPILYKITEFLVSELQAAHIIKRKELHPEEKTTEDSSKKEQRVDDHSCWSADSYADDDASHNEQRAAEIQAELVLLLHALDMDTTSQLSDVLNEVEMRIARLPCGDMANPLFNASLTKEQWMQTKKLNQVLSEDYQRRREMMIKRFQVTLESFAWGEKQKERREALASVPPLSSLAGFSRVSLSLLIAAREDQSVIEPIKAGTSTPVYKTLMGSVPDRGGRPGEIEPPMPAWEGRRAKGNQSGRGDGRHQRNKFSEKKRRGKKE